MILPFAIVCGMSVGIAMKHNHKHKHHHHDQSSGSGTALLERPTTKPKGNYDWEKELDFGTPGGNSPKKPNNGSYCIRAKCDFLTHDNNVIGNVIGHDDTMSIIDLVEQSCLMNAKKFNLKCSSPVVSILPEIRGRICEGIVFNIEKKFDSPYSF